MSIEFRDFLDLPAFGVVQDVSPHNGVTKLNLGLKQPLIDMLYDLDLNAPLNGKAPEIGDSVYIGRIMEEVKPGKMEWVDRDNRELIIGEESYSKRPKLRTTVSVEDIQQGVNSCFYLK